MAKTETFAEVTMQKLNTFGTIKGNRPVNRKHVEDLKQQIRIDPGLIPPITVNTATGNVIDGQHRTEAYKQLVAEGMLPPDVKVKVMYVNLESEDEERRCMINANVHSRTWKECDYISYYEMFDPGYKKFTTWCQSKPLLKMKNDKYRWNCGATIIKGYSCKNDVKFGKFTVTDEELAVANSIYDEINDIINAIDMKPTDHILMALGVVWHKYRKYHPFKDWIATFKRDRRNLRMESKECCVDWERILSVYHMKMERAAAKG